MNSLLQARSDQEIRRIIVEKIGDIGRITLDRFEALNALSWPMVRHIAEALDEFEGNVAAVVLDSSHPKVFCAGGDIRAIRSNTLADAHTDTYEFFAEEYALNERIATYSVPIVSVIDGVCMGGGMGLAVHGSVRIVTSKATLAMPETAIGFFPDVGSSYFLSRLPGALGRYWGLTGARISPADAIYSGLATHYVDGLDAGELVTLLSARGNSGVEEVIDGLADSRPVSAAEQNRERIERVFGETSIADMSAQLYRDESEWGIQTSELLLGSSPQSLAITLELLNWAEGKDLRACLDTELALAAEVTRTADFIEGVRAVLVDKDRNPAWSDYRFGGLDSAGKARWEEAVSVGIPASEF